MPRLKFAITPEENFTFSELNQGLLVGFIWNLLKGTPYERLHDQRGFKFFTFSELFPFGDFEERAVKHLVISSPDESFIKALEERLEEGLVARLGSHPVRVEVERAFRLPVRSRWETGSIVVLRKEDGRYWVPNKDEFGLFVEKLTRNSIEKYRAYTDKEVELPFPLFEEYELVKSVAHSFRKRTGDKVLIIGSKWRFTLPKGWKRYKEFYQFLMDVGLGEKNAMGYGFVNPMKGGGRSD